MSSQPKKVDWKLVEKGYVIDGRSARNLAVEFGLSNSTISARAREEDWDGRRLSYKNSVAQRSYEKVAESVASESAAIKGENVLAARMYVRQFIKDLNEGKIPTNAKDAAGMITLLNRELTAPESATKDDPTVIEVKHDDDLLRRVLDVARQRRSDQSGLGPGLLEHAPAARPN